MGWLSKIIGQYILPVQQSSRKIKNLGKEYTLHKCNSLNEAVSNSSQYKKNDYISIGDAVYKFDGLSENNNPILEEIGPSSLLKTRINKGLIYDADLNIYEKIDFSQNKITIENLTVGESLDTYEISPENFNGKYIIYCPGNGQIAEQELIYLAKIAKKTNCKIIAFNYRGVMHSTGQAEVFQDLVDDVKLQVDRLKNKDIAAENIILWGHSLGGAAAAGAARDLHQSGYPIKLFLSRTFSTLHNAIKDLLRSIPRLAKWLAKVATKFGWDFDVVDAWNAIPTDDKRYVVAVNDEVIRYNDSSLHKAISASTRSRIKDIKKSIQEIEDKALKLAKRQGDQSKVVQSIEKLKKDISKQRAELKKLDYCDHMDERQTITDIRLQKQFIKMMKNNLQEKPLANELRDQYQKLHAELRDHSKDLNSMKFYATDDYYAHSAFLCDLKHVNSKTKVTAQKRMEELMAPKVN